MEKELHNIKETTFAEVSAEEMKKNETKYSIVVKNNETGEVLLETNTNAIVSVFRNSNKTTEDKSCISQFCVTACDTKTLLGVLKQLDNI